MLVDKYYYGKDYQKHLLHYNQNKKKAVTNTSNLDISKVYIIICYFVICHHFVIIKSNIGCDVITPTWKPQAFSYVLLVIFYYKLLIIIFLGKYWSKEKNRRAFFERYASDNDFDYLVPDHWYNVSSSSIQCSMVRGNNDTNNIISYF